MEIPAASIHSAQTTSCHYIVRHVTRFAYTHAVSEAFTELRMQPLMDSEQTLREFKIGVTPKAQIHSYTDHWRNTVHYFSHPAAHKQMLIKTESVVEVKPVVPLPAGGRMSDWEVFAQGDVRDQYWDFLNQSRFIQKSPLLMQFMEEMQVSRLLDPLSVLLNLNSNLYHGIQYVPNSTRVDSPIDDALRDRKGVCQDFAHIFIALVRQLGIPCRYVSGYLHHSQEDLSADGASHAWAEAWLPDRGWIGFDPTNHLLAGQRHIRVAYGRDYADVPPSRGVFKGDATTKLGVSVVVAPTFAPVEVNEMPEVADLPAGWQPNDHDIQQAQQQQ